MLLPCLARWYTFSQTPARESQQHGRGSLNSSRATKNQTRRRSGIGIINCRNHCEKTDAKSEGGRKGERERVRGNSIPASHSSHDKESTVGRVEWSERNFWHRDDGRVGNKPVTAVTNSYRSARFEGLDEVLILSSFFVMIFTV